MTKHELLKILKARFEANLHRHENISWSNVEEKLNVNPKKITALIEMEKTGGEPDVVDYNTNTNEFIFFDCATESPADRRSLCYDKEALEKRKQNKPKNSAMEMATAMGIEIITVEQYKFLQSLGNFDTKTSSWLKTPNEIRKLGGAIFGDFRFNSVFIYHNGADSYYAGRGFRGILKL